jgi:hypothetical protein
MFCLPAQYFLGYFTLGCHFLPFLRCISITHVPSASLVSHHHHSPPPTTISVVVLDIVVPVIIISQT